MNLPTNLSLSEEVLHARQHGLPVVALESTVITHGLPYPENLELAREMEAEVRDLGAVPATIAVVEGRICVGVGPEDLERLARAENMHKISTRDYAMAIACGWSGGTTVAGTMLAAWLAGIRVFATGGIGGVHRQPAYDISADLPELARRPIAVVCAGAKAILDLDATLEYLETVAVPVVGYRTDEFPAFYSRSSGLKTSARADTPAQAAEIARVHWSLGLNSAILIANPPPEEVALAHEAVDNAIQQALREAAQQGIRGQAVTPFLLARVSELTAGSSLHANLGLLHNNARLAAEIAVCLGKYEG
jgi:pseudouridylate synthase